MTQVLDDLVALLSLEQIEENLFRGRSQDLGFRQLFGGQVLGQCISAASQTVAAERHVHSMHGYFLRPGDASLPVVYQVERTRDGGSFSTRRVVAVQKGQPIFFCSASFQYDEEGFHHQSQMPDVPGPENLKSETELARMVAPMIPERLRERAISDKPIEIRPVTLINPFAPQPCEPVKYVWFRAAGELPDDPQLHKYLLAYASDFNLLTTSMQPMACRCSRSSCRWPASTIHCGSTATCVWTIGCCTPWTAPGPVMRAASPVPASTTARVNWWPRSLRKA